MNAWLKKPFLTRNLLVRKFTFFFSRRVVGEVRLSEIHSGQSPLERCQKKNSFIHSKFKKKQHFFVHKPLFQICDCIVIENPPHAINHWSTTYQQLTLFLTVQTYRRSFEALLTVHFSIFISVINQLDAQKFCFTISLFHASTCFDHMCSSSGGQNCITQPLVSSH